LILRRLQQSEQKPGPAKLAHAKQIPYVDFASQMVHFVAYNACRAGLLNEVAEVLLIFAMAMQQAQNRDSDAPLIPDRLYFKIGDAARICGVETYVLRFWETQFPLLKPNKSGTGQRLYRRHDVELALRIKQLVHGQGYTLAGARQVLEEEHRRAPRPVRPREAPSRLPLLVASTTESPSGQALDEAASVIAHARAELREIASLLASPEPQPPRRRARLALIHSASGLLFPPA
jgi:DNA-binding transcriptional MerR regulator